MTIDVDMTHIVCIGLTHTGDTARVERERRAHRQHRER